MHIYEICPFIIILEGSQSKWVAFVCSSTIRDSPGESRSNECYGKSVATDTSRKMAIVVTA